MKTEILKSYIPPEGSYISKVVLTTGGHVVMLNKAYQGVFNIVIWEDGVMLEQINDLLFVNYFGVTLFAYKRGFGLIHTLKEIWLWDKVGAVSRKIKMDDPFPVPTRKAFKFLDPIQQFFSPLPEYRDDHHHAPEIFYNESDDLFYVGIAAETVAGGAAKYWTTLCTSGRKPVWNVLNVLPVAQYPVTKFGRYENEWLNIDSLIKKGKTILVHTTGGSVTRVKSGPRFEFSLISELNDDGQVIANHVIEYGKGSFTDDGRYFAFKKHGAKKLLFYNTFNFTLDFDISLTPRQNLGTNKGDHAICLLRGDTVYVYSAAYLNQCRLIR